MTSHTSAWKKSQLQEIMQLAKSYPVLAVADLTGFPASLFQDLRKKFGKKAIVRVSKARVIKKALEETGLDVSKLNEFVSGSTAVIFTEMNPFELFAFVKKNKGSVAAKANTVASQDIAVSARDTGLPPGPALSDLKSAGLKVRIEKNTIHITEDKVVARKGEPVSEAVAGTLAKLGIKPVRVGLNIIACYEKGEVFKAEALDIDIEEAFNRFVDARRKAFNLACNAAYFVSETIELLLQRAFRESRAVALEANILTKHTVLGLLAKAGAQASALKAVLPAPAEQANEKAEEKPEAKAEAKGEKAAEKRKAKE